MASDELSRPEPRSALVASDRHSDVERPLNIGPDLKAAINKVLDAVDRVAETIAVELGIRPASSRPSSSEPPAP